jgi:hypothetical protein
MKTPTFASAITALTLLLSGPLSGCAHRPHRPTACSFRAPAGADALTTASLIPPPVWADLLAPDHRDRQDPLAELHSCSGSVLITPSLQGHAQRLPSREIDERSMTMTAVGDDVLLWLRLLDFDDGDSLGVLALLSRHSIDDDPTGAHLEVRAVGTLRAPAIPLDLRVEPLGDGHRVILARGRRCRKETPCVVEVQLLPWIGDRFVDATLTSSSATEPMPARIRLREASAGAVVDGWRREAEVRRTIRAESSGLVVLETLHVRRCPGALPEGCEEEAKVHRERPLRYRDAELEIDPSIWPIAGSPEALVPLDPDAPDARG